MVADGNQQRGLPAGLAEGHTGGILTFPMLQRIVRPIGNLPRTATVVRWAKKNHVRLLEDAAGGVFTTVDALNAALGIGPGMHDDRDGNLKDQI